MAPDHGLPKLFVKTPSRSPCRGSAAGEVRLEFRLQAGPEVFRRSRLLSRQPRDRKGRSDRSTRVNAELGPPTRFIALGNPIQTATPPEPCRRRPQLRSCTQRPVSVQIFGHAGLLPPRMLFCVEGVPPSHRGQDARDTNRSHTLLSVRLPEFFPRRPCGECFLRRAAEGRETLPESCRVRTTHHLCGTTPHPESGGSGTCFHPGGLGWRDGRRGHGRDETSFVTLGNAPAASIKKDRLRRGGLSSA